MTNIKCVDCKHSMFEYTKAGNVKQSVGGACTYMIPKMKVPYSVFNHSSNHFRNNEENYYGFSKQTIWPFEEIECECYERK